MIVPSGPASFSSVRTPGRCFTHRSFACCAWLSPAGFGTRAFAFPPFFSDCLLGRFACLLDRSPFLLNVASLRLLGFCGTSRAFLVLLFWGGSCAFPCVAGAVRSCFWVGSLTFATGPHALLLPPCTAHKLLLAVLRLGLAHPARFFSSAPCSHGLRAWASPLSCVGIAGVPSSSIGYGSVPLALRCRRACFLRQPHSATLGFATGFAPRDGHFFGPILSH